MYNIISQFLEGNMNLFRALPLILACALSIPVSTQASDHKELYRPPEVIDQELFISSSTQNTVSFKYVVKSTLGTAKDVKLTAKILGNDTIKPIPSSTTITEISEGKNASLDFVLPVSIKNIKKIKIQGTVEYLPDYSAMMKNVEENADTKYQSQYLRERLMDLLKKNKEQKLKSVQAVRYIPNETKE
jgi:hypothetical protein